MIKKVEEKNTNRARRKNKIISMVIILIMLIIYSFWQNNDLMVSEYNFKSEKVSVSFENLKIVQISDLHNKKFGNHQKRLIDILKKSEPDIIVITGDLVDSKKTDISTALELAKEVVKIAPVYYVTGNHEKWLEEETYEKLINGLESYGVIVLYNQSVEIKSENDFFYLIGLDENNLTDDTLELLEKEMSPDSLKLLLAHEPQEIEGYSNANVDLVFSGHAHGGQFRLPIVGGIVAPNQGFFPEYTSGMYQYDNTTMVVSRGLGNSVIPIRIGNRPEIVITNLKSE